MILRNTMNIQYTKKYLYIFSVLPSNSGIAISGAATGYTTGI